jgi:hypothetical protein
MIDLKAVFGNGFKITGVEILNKTIFANIESINTTNKCPKCGLKSARVHSRYSRTLYDLPISEYKLCPSFTKIAGEPVLIINQQRLFPALSYCMIVFFPRASCSTRSLSILSYW